MSTMMQCSPDDPLMQAWESHKTTKDYANSKKWAVQPQHTEGSLWALFMAGWLAHAGKPDCAEPKSALSQPAPQGVEEVMDLVTAYAGSSYARDTSGELARYHDDCEDAITALVQERDELKTRVVELTLDSVKDAELISENATENVALRARVAELEGDVARDAARWRHCKKHGVPVFGLSEVTGTPSLWRAQAFGRSYIADSLQEAVDMAIAAAKEPK